MPYQNGMLLIAYPNKDVETQFEFEFYIASKEIIKNDFAQP